jgi:hypothetical protein
VGISDCGRRLSRSPLHLSYVAIIVLLISIFAGCGDHRYTVSKKDAVKELNGYVEELGALVDEIPATVTAIAEGRSTNDKAILRLEDTKRKTVMIEKSLQAFVPSASPRPKCANEGVQKEAADLMEATELADGAIDLFISGIQRKRFTGLLPSGVKLLSADYPYEFEKNGMQLEPGDLGRLYLEEIKNLANSGVHEYK